MVRELLLGPRRYKDFMAALPGLTSNLLAKRLKQLEADGILERVALEDGSGEAYALSELGAALEPVVMELGRWGSQFLTAPGPDDHVDPGPAMVSMKRRYKGGAALRVQLEVDGRPFVLGLEEDYLRVEGRRTDVADLRLRTSFAGLRKWWFMGARARDLIAAGELELEGERRDLRSFVRAFERLA